MLSAGTKLGPYEVVSPIGAGGMGEVYRARDTRLNRDVALKVLPESFARDAERLKRFEQEEQAVAALNHPNIVAIYDVGDFGGAPFLVSELLEGESLRAVLEGGPLTQRKVIDYGVQIAQGLSAAHAKGIVHRDLKPENLFVTRDGRVKILDFGLAKLAAKEGSGGASGMDAVTRTSSHTAPGVVMGTVSYMAPEQVRGAAVDIRTDMFAFGAVLYEMLSGRRAFARETGAETMTAILKEDVPELTAAGPGGAVVSPAMDRIVRRCLEKNPEDRFQSARDLGFALSALSGSGSGAAQGSGSGAAAVVAEQRGSRAWVWGGVGVAALAILGVMVFLAMGSGSSRGAVSGRMQFALPVPSEVSELALSADGQMLAFVAPDDTTGVPMLFLQKVGSASANELTGTQGATYPFWSPDKAYVGFFSHGKLQKIATTGGSPQAIAPAISGRGGSWGKTNVIIYAPEAAGTIWRVNADGSGASEMTAILDPKRLNTHRFPQFLPDGEHFFVWMGNFGNAADDESSGIYIDSLKAPKDAKLVVLDHSNASYADGRLFYADDKRRLMEAKVDESNWKIGQPEVLAELVGYQPGTYFAAFTAAGNGTVVYSTSMQTVLSQLTWFDRSGKELGRLGQPGTLCNPTISPDGTRVAVDITDLKNDNVDVWLESLRGDASTRFTFLPSEDVVPVWSRDGKDVAYASGVSDGSTLHVKPASGFESEKAVRHVDGIQDIFPMTWTPDGKEILVVREHSETEKPGSTFLELQPVDGSAPRKLIGGDFAVTNGQITSDGKWMAYASNESGNWEVYVTTFPSAMGKWQISRNGGQEPRWQADGKELYFIAPDGMLMAAEITARESFSSGTPMPLFQVRGRAGVSDGDRFTYDVSKDGKFLVDRYVKPEHVNPLTIVLNAGK